MKVCQSDLFKVVFLSLLIPFSSIVSASNNPVKDDKEASKAFSTVINFSSSSIADDEIANASKSFKTPSVTLLTEHLKSAKDKYQGKDSIDLSGNFICLKGATAILDCIFDDFKNIKRVDLSWNRILYPSGSPDISKFESSLQKVLQLKNLIQLDLTGNHIASLGWYQNITSKLGADLAAKIVWTEDEDNS